MKRSIIFLFFLMLPLVNLSAQQEDEIKYRRSSLYSILVSHSNTKYCTEIEDVFLTIPIPDKFDNHDLSVKVLTTSTKKENKAVIDKFLIDNNVARRLVAEWFNRDPETGQCDMQLISNRGLYDASWFDVELAKMSQRGYSILSDAGEELIHNTYVLVNDITYFDRNQAAKVTGMVLQTLMAVTGAVLGGLTGNSSLARNASDLGESINSIVSEIKGFGVTVTSYLYRLEWNDDIATEFYSSCYLGEGEINDTKKEAFNNTSAFKLTYVGEQSVKSGNLSMLGVSENDLKSMVSKACTRSIDKSIVALQKNFDEFKIKTPIYTASPTITAKIGMKEGVSATSRYEVLEQTVNAQGRTEYKRVGIIQPINGKIWDNRYMAIEEEAVGATLGCTTFMKISGGDFYPGMLIREILAK